MGNVVVHDSHLAASDTNTVVAHEVVVADMFMLVVWIGLMRLCGEHHFYAPIGLVFSNEGTTSRAIILMPL